MSSNVGLTTPRGSGTSGYVQRNLSHLKPRDNFAPYPKDYDSLKHRQRKPDKDILNHDRLREIEVKVFDLRDKLEDEGYVPLFSVHLHILTHSPPLLLNLQLTQLSSPQRRRRRNRTANLRLTTKAHHLLFPLLRRVHRKERPIQTA